MVGSLDDGSAEEEVSAGFDFGGVGMAEEDEGEDAGAGEGGIGGAGAALIVEAAAADGAAFEIVDASVEGALGDVGAVFGGAAEGHELPAGDGEVGIIGGGEVAPAALFVGAFADILGGENEADSAADGGLGESLAMFIEHAVGFAEGDGADAVFVHRMGPGTRGEQAVILLQCENSIHGVIQIFAIGPLAGDVATGHEGHDGEAGDGGGGRAACGAAGGPGAVGFLGVGEG